MLTLLILLTYRFKISNLQCSWRWFIETKSYPKNTVNKQPRSNFSWVFYKPMLQDTARFSHQCTKWHQLHPQVVREKFVLLEKVESLHEKLQYRLHLHPKKDFHISRNISRYNISKTVQYNLPVIQLFYWNLYSIGCTDTCTCMCAKQ